MKMQVKNLEMEAKKLEKEINKTMKRVYFVNNIYYAWVVGG